MRFRRRPRGRDRFDHIQRFGAIRARMTHTTGDNRLMWSKRSEAASAGIIVPRIAAPFLAADGIVSLRPTTPRGCEGQHVGLRQGRDAAEAALPRHAVALALVALALDALREAPVAGQRLAGHRAPG